MARVFLDSFSSPIAELPRGQRTIAHALRALDCNPRISTFDRGAPWLELLIHELKRDGLIVEDKAEPYPWHRYTITEAGKAALAQQEGRTDAN